MNKEKIIQMTPDPLFVNSTYFLTDKGNIYRQELPILAKEYKEEDTTWYKLNLPEELNPNR